MVKTKIPTLFRYSIYGIFLLAWGSGLMFFVLKTWFVMEGDFGPIKHAWQYPSLQIHGAAAFLMMITYGFLLGTHVYHAWKVKPLRIFGLLLMALPILLMISGYALYYIAEDIARDLVGYFHLAIGFSLPFVLIGHILRHTHKKRTAQKYKFKPIVNTTHEDQLEPTKS